MTGRGSLSGDIDSHRRHRQSLLVVEGQAEHVDGDVGVLEGEEAGEVDLHREGALGDAVAVQEAEGGRVGD